METSIDFPITLVSVLYFVPIFYAYAQVLSTVPYRDTLMNFLYVNMHLCIHIMQIENVNMYEKMIHHFASWKIPIAMAIYYSFVSWKNDMFNQCMVAAVDSLTIVWGCSPYSSSDPAPTSYMSSK